jgi:hypothetical protein
MDAGLKNLIEAFYRAIEGKGPLPFSHSEMLLTCRIMDEVFAQLETVDSPERVNRHGATRMPSDRNSEPLATR